jgi:hypothetical protein
VGCGHRIEQNSFTDKTKNYPVLINKKKKRRLRFFFAAVDTGSTKSSSCHTNRRKAREVAITAVLAEVVRKPILTVTTAKIYVKTWPESLWGRALWWYLHLGNPGRQPHPTHPGTPGTAPNTAHLKQDPDYISS